MKKIFIKLTLLLLSGNISAQDITINLSKSGATLSETIDGKTKNAEADYEIAAIKGFTINIKKAFKGSYKLKLTNQAAPGGIPMNEITISENERLINIDADGKITGTGTTNTVLSSKFRLLIDNVLKINFKGLQEIGGQVSPGTDFKPIGILFFDAKKLADEINTTGHDNSTILSILSYYTSLSDTKKDLKNWQDAKDAYAGNSYVLAYIKDAEQNIHDKLVIEGGGSTINMLSSAASSIAGLDVTNIADGFAKFIVKRTKQELSIAFFEKFKRELDKYKDLQTVFPQTYKALKAIGDDIYRFSAFIQGLREAFEKDLAVLPSNLPTIIDNHAIFFERFPELKAILQTSFYLAQAIQDKQHPGNIIENYPVEYLDEVPNKNIKAAFQTLKLLSASLKSNTGDDRYWASYNDIKKLFSINEDRLLKTYLGLLEQQAKLESITFNNAGIDLLLSLVIENTYTPVGTDLPKYKIYLKNLILKIESIETKVKSLKNIPNDSLKFESYYGFVTASIDLMKYLTEIEKLPRFPKGLDLQKKTSIYFYLAQTTSDVVIDVNRRNYSSAIINTIQILDTIFNTNINATFNAMRFTPSPDDRLDPVLRAQDSTAFDTAKMQQKNTSTIVSDIFKYGSFMASIAMAKNSDDVEKAIEAIALPVGSARIKRTTPFNIAINAYAGLFYGHESIKGVKDNLIFNTYGLTAPIGVSISRGTKSGFSETLFISLIDIGAVAAFRFADDTTAQVPTIQLKHIFSPGLFLSLGIPRSPISINLGTQVGPNLRKVTSTTNDYSNKTYVRYSFSVCVDLPLLNLYTRSK